MRVNKLAGRMPICREQFPSQLQIPPDGSYHPSGRFFTQLGRTLQTQFVFDMHLVRLNCFHAEMQLAGELCRAEAAANQRKNLELAIAQHF